MSTKNSAEMLKISDGRKGAGPRITRAVLCAQGNFEAAVADLAAADIIRLTRLPTNARPISIRLTADDLGGALEVDVGISDKDAVVKDVDAFAAAYVIGTTKTVLTEVIDQADTDPQKALIGDRLWEWAGDSVDPNTEYDITLTVTTSTTPAAGTIGYQILYVIV